MPHLKFESSGFSMSWGNKNPFGCNCFRIFVGTKHPKSTKTLTSWQPSIGNKNQKMRHKTQIPQEVIWKYLRYSAVNVRKLAQTFAYQGKLFYCSFKFPPVSSIRGWVPSKEALSTHHQWFYPIIIILELEQLRTSKDYEGVWKTTLSWKSRRSVLPACSISHKKNIL